MRHYITENDYIVRQWPSGRLSMGQAIIGGSNITLFKSLETYQSEGGIVSGEHYGLYGWLGSNSDRVTHRPANPIEIEVFHRFGTLNCLVQNYRELKLETLGLND